MGDEHIRRARRAAAGISLAISAGLFLLQLVLCLKAVADGRGRADYMLGASLFFIPAIIGILVMYGNIKKWKDNAPP